MKKLIYLGLVFSVTACELGMTDSEEFAKYDDRISADAKKYQIEQDDTVLELYSLASIEAERVAISEGFEPEIGAEERLELLEQYESFIDEDVFLVVRPKLPFPMPVCPPDPRGDCTAPPIELASATMRIFTENPLKIRGIVVCESCEAASLAASEYDEANRQVVLKFEENVKCDMEGSTVIKVVINTGVDSQVFSANVAEGVFY